MGGLLSSRYIADENAQIYFHTYDANGNTSELANSIGEISAHYVYDSFGKESSILGNMAALNVYRFSTKPFDNGAHLHYYGYRFYDSGLCRWLSKDPLQEKGGLNLYCFSKNNTLMFNDYLGLYLISIAAQKAIFDCLVGALGSMIVDLIVQRCKCCYKEAGWSFWSCLAVGTCPPVDDCSVIISGAVGCIVSVIGGPVAGSTVGAIVAFLQKSGAKTAANYLLKMNCP